MQFFRKSQQSKMEVALHRVTKSEFISNPHEDLEAVKKFVDDPDLWVNIFDLLRPTGNQWRPTYQALNLLLFLLDTHQCQRWAKARRTSLSARIHELTSFANKDDKRVERLVRQQASTALLKFEDIMRAFDEETEDDEIRESDFPLHVPGSPIEPHSHTSDEPKDRESVGETREDQMLLEMLEEEVWPPPSWNDPAVIGSSPKNSPNGKSRMLRSFSPFSQFSPEIRVDSRRGA
eukprot:GEMP01085931.1.p1 GENE.GEMP01085931.1~~GEMP01085931.1.p1  ORF type:complete len:234 (+),score=41.88 GEMP01085931.1:102-803(+)